MLTFVVARYKEDVRWLNELPADARVYLYNKGPAIDPGHLWHPGLRVLNLKNVGRESGTYLNHLMHRFDESEGTFTVFTQGDPFGHSPNFLDLVKCWTAWRDVQPLSVQWIAEKNIPPADIIALDRRDWLCGVPIRPEHFSLQTWAPCAFMDQGAWGIGASYRQKHMLPPSANLMEHFLDLNGLTKLAEKSRGADIGVFSYGAIFAVRNRSIATFLADARPHLEKMELLTRADPNYGYMFERTWLHFFGEPFVRFTPLDVPCREEIDIATEEMGSNGELRRLAAEAVADGNFVKAIDLLERALKVDPKDHDVLCALSGVALKQGNPQIAEAMAREALKWSPSDALATYALAKAMGRQGRLQEAEQLLRDIQAGAVAGRLAQVSSQLLELVSRELEGMMVPEYETAE